MASSVAQARRAMEKELKQAEDDVERLKNAIRALVAYENPRSTGQRMPNQGQPKLCSTSGCGTHFTAMRSDARYCSACRRERGRVKTKDERLKNAAAVGAARGRAKGVTIVKNAPSAAKK